MSSEPKATFAFTWSEIVLLAIAVEQLAKVDERRADDLRRLAVLLRAAQRTVAP